MLDYVKIIPSCVAVYIFIIAAIRLFGKKELYQLTVYDLVFILLISNAVQNAMVLGDNTLFGGVIAALTLFSVSWLFGYLKLNFPRFSKFLEGEPIVLVANGHIITEGMEKCRLSEAELMESIREHGYKSLKDVDVVIFEVDGNISVIAADHKITRRRRKTHKIISKAEG